MSWMVISKQQSCIIMWGNKSDPNMVEEKFLKLGSHLLWKRGQNIPLSFHKKKANTSLIKDCMQLLWHCLINNPLCWDQSALKISKINLLKWLKMHFKIIYLIKFLYLLGIQRVSQADAELLQNLWRSIVTSKFNK